MRRLLRLGALFSALSLLLFGCGGSGSSGFDISPLSEEAVIAEVIEGGECAMFEQLEICPTDGSIGSNPGQPGPIGRDGPAVIFDTPSGDALSCASVLDDGSCLVLVTFTAQEIPESSVFRGAVRALDPVGGSWLVGAEGAAAGDLVTIAFELPPGASSIQLAVLSYPARASSVPGEFERLADTAAGYAFVTGPLAVAAP